MATVTSATGVASGIDYDSLITGLVNAEKGTLNNLTSQQTAYQAKISAYTTLSSALTTFQTAIAKLSTQSSFNSLLAKASDTSVFSATAASTATVGTYAVKVNQLAQQQKIASGGFASTSDAIGTGTLTISFGTYDSNNNTFSANSTSPVSINITSANNTLSGIRDAINSANAGVTATIVNDGSTNRLVVTSTATGTSNTIKIGVTDGDGNNLDTAGLSQLAYDPTAAIGSGKNMTEKQAAKDALLEIDGIAVTKSSNTITDAISGVTLNLAKESAGNTVSLTVSKDTSTVQTNVQAFVNAYNTLDTTIRNLTKFVEAGSTSNGALLGDSTARGIASQLRTAMTKAITGAGSLTSLSDIGVSFQSDGKLALDTTKLATAMDTNFSDIASLLAFGGKATDALVSVTGSSAKTKEGTYAVTVTQLAQQGTVVASSGPNLNITSGNNHLDISVNSNSYGIDLTPGTYSTPDELAAEIQTKLVNAGANVTVTVQGGLLKITTNAYGSSENVSITGGSGATDIFGSSPVATAGQNVAGTINGVAATGSGQSLVGATGNASEGLIVKITGGTTGARGTVTYSQGYAYKLNEMAKQMLGTDGAIQTRTDGLNASIDRIDDQIDSQNERLDKIEARYRAQFAALESLISSMQTTSSYLTQQIAQFSSNNK